LSCAWVRWLALPERTLAQAQELISQTQPGWKPGREIDSAWIEKEAWLPVPKAIFVRQIVAAIVPAAQAHADWLASAWMLLRDQRPPGNAPRHQELELLLRAGQVARLAGDHFAALRLTALAAHLTPPQAPADFLRRVRVAAWLLAESGIEVPPHARVTLEDMLFPGEPPDSDKGREAAAAYHDAADPWHERLAREVAQDAEWQKLRSAGIALHHPLAALAWIGRKAHSYAVKKQHDLLRAAANLAARHHCLSTWGKLLAHLPAERGGIMAYARSIRENARHMPFLRSSPCRLEWTENLRLAWGKLEGQGIEDHEELFLLHETLLDREVTQVRSLPLDLRHLALRHLHQRKPPSQLVLSLEEEPRLMRQLEHQRAVELWSISSLLRERPEFARTVWVSLVRRGDSASARYSWLVQSASGRWHGHGRAKDGWRPVLDEIRTACGDADTFIVAAEWDFVAALPWPAGTCFVPSWEWAFRVIRETDPPAAQPAEILLPEGAAPPAEIPSAPPATTVLLAGAAPADASTRWFSLPPWEPAEVRRSLHIGASRNVLSEGTLVHGELRHDLVRLSLAHLTRSFILRQEARRYGLP
jgi:hypothetical protein